MNLIIIRFGKIVKLFFEKITHFEKIFRFPRTDCFKRPFQTDNIKLWKAWMVLESSVEKRMQPLYKKTWKSIVKSNENIQKISRRRKAFFTFHENLKKAEK